MPSKTRKKTAAPSFPELRFGSVAVVVEDAERSLRWYTEALGLDVIERQEHWITVGRKGRPGVLHLCQPWEGDPKSQLEPGNSGIMLQVPGSDFFGSCAAIRERGVDFAEGPTKADWGTYAIVRDPDRNEIVLMPEG
jgi:catechol 2,3-dioxygenase-like lactoylglutathione lyase family enzyme